MYRTEGVIKRNIASYLHTRLPWAVYPVGSLIKLGGGDCTRGHHGCTLDPGVSFFAIMVGAEKFENLESIDRRKWHLLVFFTMICEFMLSVSQDGLILIGRSAQFFLNLCFLGGGPESYSGPPFIKYWRGTPSFQRPHDYQKSVL
jgi:hypothetical protein